MIGKTKQEFTRNLKIWKESNARFEEIADNYYCDENQKFGNFLEIKFILFYQ